MQLQNKVIVITGASQGLGKALAIKAAQQGALVALVARSETLLKKVQEKIIQANGKAEYFVCDIRDAAAVEKTVTEIIKTYKTIDVLVNNAGIWTDNEIEKNNPNRRQEAFATNAMGNIQFTYEVLPILKEKNSGYIFNVISTSGSSDNPNSDNKDWITYGATKWALRGFTKDLSTSLHNTGIKVTGFFPGGIDTNLYENARRPNAHGQFWMMKAEDVADIILFTLTRPDDVVIENLVVTKKYTSPPPGRG
ncbi:MAG TPA: SDR family oxidoreductase [Candidatus Saccharimonadales bacterium]|nr:SDR family oxidoreductase [Candidatus Saccharimonadales bacterium]